VSRRLLLVLAAALVAIVGLLVVLGWGLYSSLTPGQRGVIRDAMGEQAALLVGSALLFAMVVGVGLGALLSRYAGSAQRLAAATEVIASVNPDHRVPHEGAPEIRAVAAAVDRLAERHRDLRRDVEETVRRASTDVEQERNRLAALMAELTQPVIVCNADGRILLYNAAARELLGAGPHGAYVGLGRSLFGVVDRELVLHALAYVRDLEARAEERATARFATEVVGRLVRAHVSPVHDAAGATAGFVLVLEDVSREAEMSDRRGALLLDLVEATQRAVAGIRAAVEAVQDFGEVDSQQQARLLRVVREEAAGLSARVEQALREAADLIAVRWDLEEMRGHDLLAVVGRAGENLQGLDVRLEDVDAGAWVRADGYALARAVAGVAERLHAEHGVRELSLSLRAVGAHAALDLRWAGAPLDAGTLRTWEEGALVSDGRRLPFTLREVLDRHGAEVWSQPDVESGGSLLRLLLPTAPEPPHPGARIPAPARLEHGQRPEFYDFDLFDRREPVSELAERRLDALSYTVFDTETTGLDPAEDELIAIGAIRIVNQRLLPQETFDQLVDPGRPVSPESQRIHGIVAGMLAGQPGIGDVLPRFGRFAEDTVLVGHNVAFDMRFLADKEAQTDVRFAQPVLDTLLLSPVVHPDYDDHSLEAIAARLGVSVIGRHTALGDALVTAEIFVGLLRLLAERGIVTLGQALDASRRTYQARVSDSLYAPVTKPSAEGTRTS
jgi:DNA polymerase III subunit epsilon